MNIEFTAHGWEDFNYWLENDKEVVKKIKELIKAIIREPFKGIGTPEPLKFGLKGFWSRRINGMKDVNQKCTIIQCRFHYD